MRWICIFVGFSACELAIAGQIRRLELSEDHPGTVVVALGRTTAISFTTRPEKVVPGSPQALQVNFLGSDLTVTPVSRKPGNLLVYTKTRRYVILFRMGSDANYDDVVRIGGGGKGRPLRLLTDSYRLAVFKVRTHQKNGGRISGVADSVTVQLTSDLREISGEELAELLTTLTIQAGALHCRGCMVRAHSVGVRIQCVKPIDTIQCETKTASLSLEREAP